MKMVDTRDKYWEWYMPDMKAAMTDKLFEKAALRAISGKVTKENLDWVDEQIDTRFPVLRTTAPDLMAQLKRVREEL